jgi:hypothetical protein
MKKITPIITFVAIIVSLLFTSCVAFAKDVKGDGKLVTKSISISDFSKVEIEVPVTVDYSQSINSGSLEFTVDNNLFEYYDIKTKNGTLYIEIKKEYKNKIQPKPTNCLITVSSKQLSAIEIAGSTTFNFLSAFTSEKLNIEIAGSGKIIAKKHPVKIEECAIEIAGSGNIVFTGSINKAQIEIAGSGSVKALDCKIKQLAVEIAGSGTVDAEVTDKLNVEIAGSGNVNYKGDPKVETDITGSGKVKKL